LERPLIERWLTAGCDDPQCWSCARRRRRREMLFSDVVTGIVAAVFIELLLLGLKLIGFQ
jgi:hypothetical protein